ncbi:MAG TPA: TonB-dependent receptor [Steroidobacteraceae bacterium]|nr:TonB-dependent receptor [Steroidobacteraceae bacterium]
MHNRRVALGLSLCLSAALARAVTAEEKTPADSATSSEGLTEIVVTARKRSESAQDIPVSVQALDGSQLSKQGIKDLFEAVTLVPGVVFSRAPDDGLALTFRGLGTQARPQAFEQSVALFTDGIFMGKSRLYSASFFDVDRMEFIKGTESTLLGKNASLGAISIVSKQPGDTFTLEGRGGYEFQNGGPLFDVASNIPLTDGVSMRVAAHYSDLDGWVHNDFTKHDGPEHKDTGARVTLRARVNDALSLTGSYQYSDQRQIGSNYQLVGQVPGIYGDGVLDGHTSQFTGLTNDGDTQHETKSHLLSLKAELQLGENSLVSQSSYVHYDLHNVDDFDFSPDDSINFTRVEAYNQFAQEIRFASPSDRRIDYMVGAFFLHSHWNSQEGQLWAVPGFPPAGGPPPGQLFNGPFFNHFIQDSNAYSAFASSTWNLTDSLKVSGGARYTREDKDANYGRTNSAPYTVWNTIANPPFDPTALRHASNFLDGNLSLQYELARDMMAYLAYGHGSKSGGFVETNTIAVPPTLLINGKVPAALVAAGSGIKDEFTSSYEVGLKSTLLEHRLRINIDAFWTNIKDFQDTVFTGGTLGFITSNGPARSRGVELNTAYAVTAPLKIYAGATFADATGIIQPIDPATVFPEVDSHGNPVLARYRLTQAPRVIANVGGAYDIALPNNLTLQLGAEVRYRSSMFNQLQEQFFSKELTTLNVSAGIESESGRWGVDVAARNVTNAISEDFASPSVDPRFGSFYGAYLAGPNALRTVTLTVHARL